MQLNDAQMQRYCRNVAVDEIGKEGQEQLFGAKILVCGAGGLGSTVIANLASLGVGNLGIVDDDVVELSNLNRQYIHTLENIGRLKTDSARNWVENYNKDITIKTFKIRMDKENWHDIISAYDIIVDCFDSFGSKFLLNDISIISGKPLVHGGVTGFQGQVMTIFPKKSTCLRCIFPDADEHTYISKGVVSPAVSMIASFQSMEVLKLILGKGELLTNKILFIDGLNLGADSFSGIKVLNMKQNLSCKCAI